MAELWLPNDNQVDAEREALVTRTLGDHLAEGRALERELRSLDPYLRVVFITENAPMGVPGVVPGRWHVQRKNPGAPDSYLPILGPDGEYSEPSYKLIEDMKRNDLWKEGAMEKLMQRRDKEVRERQKREELHREQLRDEAKVVHAAAKRVSGEGGMHKRSWGKGVIGHG